MSLTIDGTLRDFNDLFSFSVDMEEGNDEINLQDEVESIGEVEVSDEVKALFERGEFLLDKVKRSAEERYELSAITKKLQDLFLERFKDSKEYLEVLEKNNSLINLQMLNRRYRTLQVVEQFNNADSVYSFVGPIFQFFWKAGSFVLDAGKFIFKVGKGFSAAFLKFSPSLFNTVNLNIGIGGFKNTELLLIKDKQLASQEKRMALLEQEILEERQQVRMERETNRLLEGRMTELKVKYKAVKKTLKQRTKAQKTDRAFKDIYRTPSFDSSKYACRSASEDKDLFSSHTAPMTSY